MIKNKKIIFFINHVAFFVSHRLPLALEAINRGYDVELITGQPGSISMEEEALVILKKNKITFNRISFESSGVNIIKEFKSLIQLYRLLKIKDPDIIHMASPKAVFYGGFICHFLKARALIFSFSGFGFAFTESRDLSFFRNFMKFISRFFLKLIFFHKKIFVIVQNKDDLNFFLDKNILKKSQISLIKGSGVNFENYNDISFKKKEKKIIFPARVLLDKGIKEFVQAANILKPVFPDWQFIVAGAFDYKNPSSISSEQIQKIVSKNSVVFLGHLSHIEDLFKTSSIVCLPSYREGMPKALLEAQAAGCAVVTTDVIGCRESILDKQTGFLVKPYDILDLVSALEKLILNKDLRENFGKEGINFSKKNFDIKVVLDKVMNLYDLLTQK